MGKRNKKRASIKTADPLPDEPAQAKFEYKHLNDWEIRLMTILPQSTGLDIRCSLRHVIFGGNSKYGTGFTKRTTFYDGEWCGPYIALSYCWGKSTATRLITLDGQPFRVTANLFNALRAILRSHNISPWYWIDAICIDQQNDKEKTVQVRKMGAIYARATMVISWLGSAEESAVFTLESRDLWLDDDSMREVEGQLEREARQWNWYGPHAQRLPTLHLRRLFAFEGKESWRGRGGQSRRKRTQHPLNDKVLEDQITRLLENDYFSRTWIIPEFTGARRIAILGGNYACSSEYLHSCCSLRQSLVSGYNNALQLLQMRHGSYDNKQHGSDEQKYRTLDGFERVCRILETSFKAKCADRRDCVFAVASQIRVIEVDYSLTPAEVFVITLERLDLGFASEFAKAGSESVSMMRDLFQRVSDTLANGLLEHGRYVHFGKVSRPFMGEWLQDRKTWDCSQLPLQICLPSGRLIDCSGPIWKYLLQGDIDIPPSDVDPIPSNEEVKTSDDAPSLSNPSERPFQPISQPDKQTILTQALDDAKTRLAAVDQQLQDLHLDYNNERKARAMLDVDRKALEISESDFEVAYEEMFAEAERERRAALLAQEAADEAYWRGIFRADSW